MNLHPFSPDQVCEMASRGLRNVIVEETEKIVVEEAKEAALRVEKRVRALTGQIATNVFNSVAFERFGNDIKISIVFPGKEPVRNGV